MRGVSMQPTERWKKNLSKAARAAEQRLHFGNRTGRLKAGITERIEDGVNTARRAAKHGYRAAEEFVDDTTHRIKRDPLRVLGFCFAAGVAAGWLLPHRTRG